MKDKKKEDLIHGGREETKEELKEQGRQKKDN